MQKNVGSVNLNENITSLMCANIFMGNKSGGLHCPQRWEYWKKSPRETLLRRWPLVGCLLGKSCKNKLNRDGGDNTRAGRAGTLSLQLDAD
jgi:hypothetical protein